MNPIDWGNSPITVSLMRGVIAAILIALLQALVVRNGANVSWEVALTSGAISGIPTLLALLGYGAFDQNRANNGIAIPGDVPVASEELKVTKVKT